MEKIDNVKMKDKYIEEYKINSFFSHDVKPFAELILFKKNEYICRENEKLSYLYFFISGKAKVYATLSNGKSLLLCFYNSFKMLGDVEFPNGENAYNNVQAIEDTYCIGIPVEKLRLSLLKDAKFLKYLCISIGEKLNRCSKNSSINLLYPLENRLASYIIAAGERIYSNGITVIRFNENLTEISELLGASYRHLLRTLNTLCSKGALLKEHSYYVVKNEKVMKELAADLYQ
ncbi:transcriptional regulator YeiL [Clostridium sp. JN-9]|uniref:transcriptional regulator YeiL n=1 Tax=Clostridium sp. JN-9 TaxID=2507159 RepID=UPI000FFDF85F|nr:transcriptional regulator YeiL [Clostridium sp. JN-9]QAT41233.1 transcriptional regulator YeiL [Clostridium sp. JN-9]